LIHFYKRYSWSLKSYFEMDELERCILVKSEVFVYKIPPRQSARGYRAADWNLSNPDWTGRMRVMERGGVVTLKLEDRGSNDLFAACPVETYPGPAIEAVTDSSRYFVIRIVNEVSKQSAYIGLGFSDRSDSFDLNVALQDYFKGIRKEVEIKKEDEAPKVHLDLAFKAGQTIKVNIKDVNKDKDKPAKQKSRNNLSGSLLPPPPSVGSILPPPPSVGSIQPPPAALVSAGPPSNPSTPSSNVDLLADFDSLSMGSKPSAAILAAPAAAAAADDPWGDFASADTQAKSSGNWVQF